MKYFCLFSLFFSNALFAFDWTFKTDFTRNSTNNVNSSSTKVSDTYSDLIGTLTAKNDQNKFKLKAKIEKYSKTTDYDNNTITGSYVFKPTKLREYQIDLSQQSYKVNGAVTNSDTASDNRSLKLGTTWNYNISKDQSGSINLTSSYRDYFKNANRKDLLVDASFNYENYLTEAFSVSPELNLEYNKSKDSTYSNLNLGPALYLNYSASDNLDFFVNLNLTYTNYTSRTFTSTTKNNKTVSNKEHQTLFSNEIGTIYTIFDKITLQAKYSQTNNTSNNSASAYKTNLFTFNVGLKI